MIYSFLHSRPMFMKKSWAFSAISFQLSNILLFSFNWVILGTVGYLLLIIDLIPFHIFLILLEKFWNGVLVFDHCQDVTNIKLGKIIIISSFWYTLCSSNLFAEFFAQWHHHKRGQKLIINWKSCRFSNLAPSN